jgi:uncharacterized protein YciI
LRNKYGKHTQLKIRDNFLVAIVFILSVFLISCQANHSNDVSTDNSSEVVKFDSSRAAKLGADDYGMKKYVFAFLKRGPNRPTDKQKSAELQKAHMENIGRLARAGKLVLAGPFMDNNDLRGIYIFDVDSIEEAEQLTNTDPAIQYGSLVMELKEWYGSAALGEVNDIHKIIAKKTM